MLYNKSKNAVFVFIDFFPTLRSKSITEYMCKVNICTKASSSLLMLIDFFNISKLLYSFDKHRHFQRLKLFSFFSGDSPFLYLLHFLPTPHRADGPASGRWACLGQLYKKKDVRGSDPITSYAGMRQVPYGKLVRPWADLSASGEHAYYIYSVTLRCPRERR